MYDLGEITACVGTATAAHADNTVQLVILMLAGSSFVGGIPLLACNIRTAVGLGFAVAFAALCIGAFAYGLLTWGVSSKAVLDCIP